MSAPYETVVTDAAIEKNAFVTLHVAVFRLLELKKLRPVDAILFAALAKWMKRPKGWRVGDAMTGAHPGIEKLMRMIGVGSRDTLFASLARLEAGGVIRRTRRSRTSNAYAIPAVREWDLSCPAFVAVLARRRATARFGGRANGLDRAGGAHQ